MLNIHRKACSVLCEATRMLSLSVLGVVGSVGVVYIVSIVCSSERAESCQVNGAEHASVAIRFVRSDRWGWSTSCGYR